MRKLIFAWCNLKGEKCVLFFYFATCFARFWILFSAISDVFRIKPPEATQEINFETWPKIEAWTVCLFKLTSTVSHVFLDVF